MQISNVPAHRWSVTVSCRTTFPRNAAITYPIAVTGKTKLKSARLSRTIRVSSAKMSAAIPIATKGQTSRACTAEDSRPDRREPLHAPGERQVPDRFLRDEQQQDRSRSSGRRPFIPGAKPCLAAAVFCSKNSCAAILPIFARSPHPAATNSARVPLRLDVKRAEQSFGSVPNQGNPSRFNNSPKQVRDTRRNLTPAASGTGLSAGEPDSARWSDSLQPQPRTR